MDSQELCLKVEQATKALTPLSVTLVDRDGRIATIRIVAEAFNGMKLPARITTVLSHLNAFDGSILKTFDLAFELLSPAESTAWGAGSGGEGSKTDGGGNKIAARDANP